MGDFTTYNVATQLLESNLANDRGARTAVIDRDGAHSYADIAANANRFGNFLLSKGINPGQRALLALTDEVAFAVCFLGAMKAGIVPVPLNTLLTADDYSFIVEDSAASALVASSDLVGQMPADSAMLKLASHGDVGEFRDLWAQTRDCSALSPPAPTAELESAFWLYTSGTTGRPKGVMHGHRNLAATADNYAQHVLGLHENDVIYSAAKLFFAYGLGNSLTFPMSVGATVILLDSAPTPAAVAQLINEHRPTVFFGVPTLYAMMLNTGNVPATNHQLRLCISAGEALPEAILNRWQDATGVEILDGIGSTEMLHIYMSNRSGGVQAGTSGTPVPNYEVRLLDDSGAHVAPGEMGDLYVKGPSMCQGYWNRAQLNLDTFNGDWMRTGDKYQRADTGAYAYCGRSDDLLKVGGIYVSPMEVENALLEHAEVAEAAVVGCEDDDQLIKPKAFVVPAAGSPPSPALANKLIDHVATKLAAYKRPRWVEFVDTLPKTATGKIQRFKLRD